MSKTWTSAEIKQAFFDFFEKKGHKIVPSAPIVVKGDPTLMFTNAGMNQFKDYFLNNEVAQDKRVADTQKCLRVSGKHNDLEEVGYDHYHHTMFEMLGNWSFGDYFKKEAIAWAWELLTEVYGLDKSRLYVTVFEGAEDEGLKRDTEAEAFWKEWVSQDRILLGNKKDNFWEMGDTGPCGPCTEIHYDGRSDQERAQIDGASLVNKDHEDVIEIWNNVFMEFNRKADGSLELLPEKHVDTGMGFERLVRIIQNKNSNYDTDVFSYIINTICELTGKEYGQDPKVDIAIRVITDHIRAASHCIADGVFPSGNKQGYVVRLILRRAIRYGYTWLGLDEPFMYRLVNCVASYFKHDFPELAAQQEHVESVIRTEEEQFFKTLKNGMERLNAAFEKGVSQITGDLAFELHATYGFPIEMIQQICRENHNTAVDMERYNQLITEHKELSKKDAEKETGDWVFVKEGKEEFVGYDTCSTETYITRYRTIKLKGVDEFQIVLAESPFFAESGGQVGDTGTLTCGEETIQVLDCQKDNKLNILLVDKLFTNPEAKVQAAVNFKRRELIKRNHSATHLMHSALKQVLGEHVSQKGSLVNEKVLRFDFNHFAKVEDEQLAKVEQIVNSKIQEEIKLEELRDIPIAQAEEMGATALFGEKYGDKVRVIIFDKDFSMELCGGTHVSNTREINVFKFISEGSVASGVRRVEAVTSARALDLLSKAFEENEAMAQLLNHPKNNVQALEKLLNESTKLRHAMAQMETQMTARIKQDLLGKVENHDGFNRIVAQVQLPSADAAKNLCFQLKNQVDKLACVLAYEVNSKPGIAIIFDEEVLKQKGWKAGALVREWGRFIQGGGGGQDFFATAGGKDVEGLPKVIQAAKEWFV